MYKNLHFKIVVIFVVFTMAIMSAVGAMMLYNTVSYYTDEFDSQMESAFGEESDLFLELISAFSSENHFEKQNEILKAYSGTLGIDGHRNYYVLNADGVFAAGSDAKLGEDLEITPNIVSAMNGGVGNKSRFWEEYIDYAVCISAEGKTSIIYIKDTQEEVRSFTMMIFQMTVQSMFFGLLVAVVLSFFLARAITEPIRKLTIGAQRIADGEFEQSIDVKGNDEIGALSETFSNMKDVLKNTLDEISGERQKFETLFLYLKDAVIVFNRGGKLMHINKMAKKLFEFNTPESEAVMKGFTFSAMINLLQIDYKEVSVKYKENKNHVVNDVIYNGKALDVTFADFKYSENGETLRGIMCLIHDVTGRYELDKSRREFVADVSHELRTPLTGIKGAVETVLENPTLDDEIKNNFLEMAIEECDRMTRIVGDLLVLSRLDNKRTSWKVETFELSRFVEHIYDVMSADAKAKNHTFTKVVYKDIPEITADREKLQQVVINIVSNAVKYTPEGGKIDIFAKGEKGFAVIRVTDNGWGIPEEDLPRIFERFYRVEKSRTSDAGGTGLGLAIAKEILDAHGGDISIESAVGKGTAVTVKIPYACKLEMPKA
ncbi:MAG: cell wall metabolism sensor histidine kinase WalK [Ruminococcaceae bacterium]|nr:cell wall metabolism sensor histidine kinase WalK [Oscillospiraceae bacterium]